MGRFVVDINVDVGEGLGNESQLLPYISSCNIACGGHAGDEESMREVVKLAKLYKVKVGAHPSYPDKENFGRESIKISCADLYTSLKKQVRSLTKILYQENVPLHHIKPHGALYNKAAVDVKTAQVIIEVIKSIAMPVALYVPYKSVIADLASKENIKVTFEAFADRNYNDDFTLVSRKEPDAIIESSEAVFDHVYNMILTQKVKTISGAEMDLKADTFCVHGDHPKAVEILQEMTAKLKVNNVKIL
ncbi:5-oxoprolinase subunit PxpA [Mangrovimonas sp. TPBH4]|uniref:5-oxoprolinase subunit PxpA n=1 Tax=Mangrovimonas sp. TPBH4 TaxID=1645914 RepID=UPI0006B47694|nr:5-oxoprolinase subunit PxpA [Mangrovimonas sp. TPBH4]